MQTTVWCGFMFLFVLPAASGFNCYQCEGAYLNSQNRDVRSFFGSMLKNEDCALGRNMKSTSCEDTSFKGCRKINTTVEGTVLSTKYTIQVVKRLCAEETDDPEGISCDGEIETPAPAKFPGTGTTLSSTDCVCNLENCNGQTALSPTNPVMTLVVLLFGIYFSS